MDSLLWMRAQPVSETSFRENYQSDRVRTNKPYNFGAAGGKSRALHCETNPFRPCDPSQKGLFSASPQRQREITDRPPNPYEFPSESWMVKSPSMRIGPLLITVTFVAMHPDSSKWRGTFEISDSLLPYNWERRTTE